MQNKKGVAPLIVVFIIFVVFLMIAVLTIDFSGKTGISSQEKEQQKVSAAGLESVKSFVYHTSQEIGYKATIEAAKMSALDNNGFWMVYSTPDKPDIDRIMDFLASYIKNGTNDKLKNMTNMTFGNTIITDAGLIDSVEISVTPLSVYSGENNIGFYANMKGSEYSASQDGRESSYEHKYSVFVTPDTFFEAINVIGTWIDEGVLQKKICDYMKIRKVKCGRSGDKPVYARLYTTKESDVIRLIDESINDLNERFNGDYSCYYNVLCLNFTDTIMTDNWEECFDCTTRTCNYDNSCDDTSATCSNTTCSSYKDSVCSAGGSFNQTNYSHNPADGSCDGTDEFEVPEDSCMSFSEDRKISFTIEVVCIDAKYKYPVSNEGSENIQLSFNLSLSLDRKEDPDTITRGLDYDCTNCAGPSGCKNECDSCTAPCTICFDQYKDGNLTCVASKEAFVQCNISLSNFTCKVLNQCNGVCAVAPDNNNIFCDITTNGSCQLNSGCPGVCKPETDECMPITGARCTIGECPGECNNTGGCVNTCTGSSNKCCKGGECYEWIDCGGGSKACGSCNISVS